MVFSRPFKCCLFSLLCTGWSVTGADESLRDYKSQYPLPVYRYCEGRHRGDIAQALGCMKRESAALRRLKRRPGYDSCFGRSKDGYQDVERCINKKNAKERRRLAKERRRLAKQRRERAKVYGHQEPGYQEPLVRRCARETKMFGFKHTIDCWRQALVDMSGSHDAITVITREIRNRDSQLRLMAICFKDWDTRPTTLRDSLHCVKTKSRNYRLHGRF